jgi:hypothetical protein
MSVQELEAAVRRLSPPDLTAFARWFEEYLADEWDRQIEADAAAGKLDGLADQAIWDYKAGRCKPLRTIGTGPRSNSATKQN